MASNIPYFTAVSVLLTIAPGPDILYVITQSITQGKKAGITTGLGLCTGLIVHTIAASLGISAVLLQSAAAFGVLKYLGACYLFFLAWKAFREKESLLSITDGKVKSSAFLYRQGIFMNVLNPKVALFFLAFLPQFVDSEAGNVPGQMIMLGFLFMMQAVLVFTIVAVFAGILSKKALKRPGIAKYINYAKAGILALIGIKLALAQR
jgi:threonine/homoserine/homoserine lactone efflux protein